MQKVTADVARELLRYEPEIGILFWRERERKWFSTDRQFKTWNIRYAGSEAFTIDSKGYRQSKIFGRNYQAHRVIWLMQTGEWPDEVDHINHDRSDNRWSNLREVNHAENLKNASLRRDNTSGVVGVRWCEPNAKWRAEIKVKGAQKHIGLFASFGEAVAARRGAEVALGFHANHGKRRA